VQISIPFQEIENERFKLREKAKQEVKNQTRDEFTVLNDPLPAEVKIIISDNGHGMSPTDIAKKTVSCESQPS